MIRRYAIDWPPKEKTKDLYGENEGGEIRYDLNGVEVGKWNGVVGELEDGWRVLKKKVELGREGEKCNAQAPG